MVVKQKYYWIYGILALAVLGIILISGGIQNESQNVECTPKASIVDPILLNNLENSEYISNLRDEGFNLTRFRGPADSCSEIPDNYVHLNFWYPNGDFLYRLTIQTKCDPSTLVCDFNSNDFFEQIDYLESMNFISAKIESGYYKEGEVNWMFDQDDRVRYHQQKLVPTADDLDIYLVNNKIVKAIEGNINRCADGNLICNKE
jgi:hypothetical protein